MIAKSTFQGRSYGFFAFFLGGVIIFSLSTCRVGAVWAQHLESEQQSNIVPLINWAVDFLVKKKDSDSPGYLTSDEMASLKKKLEPAFRDGRFGLAEIKIVPETSMIIFINELAHQVEKGDRGSILTSVSRSILLQIQRSYLNILEGILKPDGLLSAENINGDTTSGLCKIFHIIGQSNGFHRDRSLQTYESLRGLIRDFIVIVLADPNLESEWPDLNLEELTIQAYVSMLQDGDSVKALIPYMSPATTASLEISEAVFDTLMTRPSLHSDDMEFLFKLLHEFLQADFQRETFNEDTIAGRWNHFDSKYGWKLLVYFAARKEGQGVTELIRKTLQTYSKMKDCAKKRLFIGILRRLLAAILPKQEAGEKAPKAAGRRQQQRPSSSLQKNCETILGSTKNNRPKSPK